MIDRLVFNVNYTTTRPLVLNKTIAKTLANTEGTMNNGHSRETGSTGHTRRRKTKQKHNTTCIGDHYTEYQKDEQHFTAKSRRVNPYVRNRSIVLDAYKIHTVL